MATKLSEQLSDTGIPIKTDNRGFIEVYKQISDMVVD